jgi:hypothetical protein
MKVKNTKNYDLILNCGGVTDKVLAFQEKEVSEMYRNVLPKGLIVIKETVSQMITELDPYVSDPIVEKEIDVSSLLTEKTKIKKKRGSK